ncbi:MAG: tRNA (adenosine(37)-N6)-threonylcarbamoyltransferase complex ATPase subunit type 1 TsaE [Alphaproteobacteria bacterium]|nr:tRNA (adenosine(37)-N6)-threonylcarbamoyltransferase complex ATPase subunit type 1 TsaE [Alphaproteobacteria bacterium]
MRVKIPLPDLKATEALAATIAPILKPKDAIALSGDLGTGKTTFARALLRTLGVKDDIPSPTFTLVQTYDIGKLSVSHFDLYRLKSSSELDELGLDDARADGIVLVEWPERAEGNLPKNRLTLNFSIANDGSRSCLLEGEDAWLTRLPDLKKASLP